MRSPISESAVVTVAFGLVLGHAPLTSAAEGPREAAKAALVEGVKLLDRRHYAKALRKFDEAYALVPSPKVAYNRGLAYVGLDDAPHAYEAFRHFLAKAQDAPAANRAIASSWVSKLAARVGFLRVTSTVPATRVLVDGETRGEATMSGAQAEGGEQAEGDARATGPATAASAGGPSAAVPSEAWAVLPGVRNVVCDAGPGRAPAVRTVAVARGETATLACDLAPLASAVVGRETDVGSSRGADGPRDSTRTLALRPPEVASALPPAALDARAPGVPGPALLNAPTAASSPSPPAEDPIYKRWWFWAGVVGAVAGAGVLTYVLVHRNSGPTCDAALDSCTIAN